MDESKWLEEQFPLTSWEGNPIEGSHPGDPHILHECFQTTKKVV